VLEEDVRVPVDEVEAVVVTPVVWERVEVVDRLPAGVEVEVKVNPELEAVEVVVEPTAEVTDPDAALDVVVVEATAEEPEDEEPPVMWKGKEYWKMVELVSQLIMTPYVA
jgi:hypothetical protein